MTDMTVSTKPLEQALAALNEGITITQSILLVKKISDAQKNIMRAGVIQNFEFCYELSWKTLKRKLSSEMPSPELLDTMPYQSLIREGAQRGFIADAEKWMKYRHKRNLTSHTYHAKTAEEVYQAALVFYQDAFDLLQKLKENKK